MIILKVVAIILLVIGFGIVYAAKPIVRKFELEKRAKCDFEHEMTEEELKEYKLTRAQVNVKMLGMLVALPGLILVILAFR